MTKTLEKSDKLTNMTGMSTVVIGAALNAGAVDVKVAGEFLAKRAMQKATQKGIVFGGSVVEK